jgi:hypothetical protein
VPRSCAEACREDLVLIASWRMDSAEDGRELRDALAGYAAAMSAGEPAAVHRRGERVALVLAPDAQTGTGVAEAQVAP